MRRLVALVAARGALQDPAALLFASRSGSGLERKVAREALKRAVKAAGLAKPEPSLHDLRHSHASMLIALDVPVVDVQRRLGHRKPDTTLRVYAHQWKEREARRSQVGQQLGQLFERHRELTTPTVSGSRSRPPPAMPDQYGFNHLGDNVRCIDCPIGGPIGHWPEHKRAEHACSHGTGSRQKPAADLRRQRILLAAPPTQSNEEKEAITMANTATSKGEPAKQVAIDVLRKAGEPLHAKEIAKRVLASGRCVGLKGKTPEATISAMLAVGSKPGGPFTRVDKAPTRHRHHKCGEEDATADACWYDTDSQGSGKATVGREQSARRRSVKLTSHTINTGGSRKRGSRSSCGRSTSPLLASSYVVEKSSRRSCTTRRSSRSPSYGSIERTIPDRLPIVIRSPTSNGCSLLRRPVAITSSPRRNS
jgi:hypothetical protein